VFFLLSDPILLSKNDIRFHPNPISVEIKLSVSENYPLIMHNIGEMWDHWDTLTNFNLGKHHLPVITFFSFSHCGTNILVRCFTCVFVADNNCSDV